MSVLTRVSVAFAAGAVLACGSDNTVVAPPPRPAVAVVSGNNQSAVGGHQLPMAIVVSVTAPGGAPMYNMEVGWKVTSGDGTLSAASTLTKTDGQASVDWTLGSAPVSQSVAAMVNGAESPAIFLATATAQPIVLHFDGTIWAPSLLDNHGAHTSLESIWGASATRVYAIGGACGPVILAFNGATWDDTPTCAVGSTLDRAISIWGNSASDIFAIERSGVMTVRTAIIHYDGSAWTDSYSKTCLAPCSGRVLGVWTRSANDAMAVGDDGTILHYDGTSWNAQTSGTTQSLSAVWGDGAGGGVFAVGDAGTILFNDGTGWGAQVTGTTQPLFAVWGTSTSNVFAAGGGGVILHYDGASWTSQTSGTTQALRGIWGASPSSVFIVGSGSTILHYDGTSWTPQAVTTPINLHGIWGSSATNVFAAGGP